MPRGFCASTLGLSRDTTVGESSPRAIWLGRRDLFPFAGAEANVLRYQSITEPSSPSNCGMYGRGSPTCFISLSSSIVMPSPGSVSRGRWPLTTGGIGLARRFVCSLSPRSWMRKFGTEAAIVLEHLAPSGYPGVG